MLLSKAYEDVIRNEYKRLAKCFREFALFKGDDNKEADFWYNQAMQCLRIIDSYAAALSDIKQGRISDHEI